MCQERDPEYEDEPEGVIGRCEGCGGYCQAIWVDDGIGPYEFWGDRGYHHDWRWVSPCCGAEVVENKGDEDDAEV